MSNQNQTNASNSTPVSVGPRVVAVVQRNAFLEDYEFPALIERTVKNLGSIGGGGGERRLFLGVPPKKLAEIISNLKANANSGREVCESVTLAESPLYKGRKRLLVRGLGLGVRGVLVKVGNYAVDVLDPFQAVVAVALTNNWKIIPLDKNYFDNLKVKGGADAIRESRFMNKNLTARHRANKLVFDKAGPNDVIVVNPVHVKDLVLECGRKKFGKKKVPLGEIIWVVKKVDTNSWTRLKGDELFLFSQRRALAREVAREKNPKLQREFFFPTGSLKRKPKTRV
ncbi:MAG: hypothetical protein NTY48_03355 [Candidatus Diapherotrites archaeon]|nr:hypothetical protein [Candidatus Diapherotrites archaeon]